MQEKQKAKNESNDINGRKKKQHAVEDDKHRSPASADRLGLIGCSPSQIWNILLFPTMRLTRLRRVESIYSERWCCGNWTVVDLHLKVLTSWRHFDEAIANRCILQYKASVWCMTRRRSMFWLSKRSWSQKIYNELGNSETFLKKGHDELILSLR